MADPDVLLVVTFCQSEGCPENDSFYRQAGVYPVIQVDDLLPLR